MPKRSSGGRYFPSLIAILLMVSGCTSTEPVPQSVRQSAEGKKLAIISMIGSTMRVKRVGTTVLGNAERALDVSPWALDKKVGDSVAVHARQRGYMVTLVDEAAVKERFANVDSFDSVQVWKIGAQKKMIVEYAREAGVDMIIVIGAPDYTDVIYRTNQKLKSYGIYEMTGWGGYLAVNYALLQTLVFDGADGSQLGYQTDYAKRERAESARLPENQTVSADELEGLRIVITQLYEQLLKDALNNLRL